MPWPSRCTAPRWRCAGIAIAVAVGLGASALGCATPGANVPHPGVRPLWRRFETLPPMRAMAIAGDPDRIWVGAAVGDEPSRAAAESNALAACREKRIAARIQTPCRLYASGDEIVWDPYAREGRRGASDSSTSGAAEP